MEYPKIETLFKRDPETKHRTLLEGQYANPAFEYLVDCQWRLTEKVDGTNIRIMIDHYGVVRYGGRTDHAQIQTALLQVLMDMFEPMRPMLHAEFPGGDTTLYGEGYGAKIQKGGGNYRQDLGFVLFDVMVGRWWLEHENVQKVAYVMGLDTVPVLGCGCTLDDMEDMVKGGMWSRWSTDANQFYGEGIVARPMVELRDRAGRRIITKLKRKDFTEEELQG